MNKKRIAYLLMFVLISYLVSACQLQAAETKPTDPVQATVQDQEGTKVSEVDKDQDDAEPEPTGYSDGGIQIPTIFYAGTLFSLDENLGSFERADLDALLQSVEVEALGTVKEETNHRWPNQDFEASRVAVESAIYVNAETGALLAVIEGKTVYRFKPYTEVLYELDPKP